MLWLYDAQGDPSLWTVRYLSSVLQFLNVKICSGNKNIGTAARVGQMHRQCGVILPYKKDTAARGEQLGGCCHSNAAMESYTCHAQMAMT